MIFETKPLFPLYTAKKIQVSKGNTTAGNSRACRISGGDLQFNPNRSSRGRKEARTMCSRMWFTFGAGAIAGLMLLSHLAGDAKAKPASNLAALKSQDPEAAQMLAMK